MGSILWLALAAVALKRMPAISSQDNGEGILRRKDQSKPGLSGSNSQWFAPRLSPVRKSPAIGIITDFASMEMTGRFVSFFSMGADDCCQLKIAATRITGSFLES
jgi:hypothetical protein